MQLLSVQVLRAIAALLVLFAHLTTPFSRAGAPDAFPNFIAGAAGVDLFFVISGFVMVYSSENFFGSLRGSATFMFRRLCRIVPLYWATTTFVLLMAAARHDVPASEKIFISYFFIPSDTPPVSGVGWTLEYEMFFYCLFALCVALPRRSAVVMASAVLCALFYTSPTWPAYIAHFSNHFLLEFVLGMLIALAYRNGIRIPALSSLCAITIGTAVYLWTCTQPIGADIAHNRHILWGGSAAFVLAGCVLSHVVVKKSFWYITLIGEVSYALYLTHPSTLEIVGLLVAKNLPGNHPYVYAALLFSVAIGVSVLVHKYFELPITRALRNQRSISTISAEKSFP